jgi:hypothetical protein
MPGETTHQAALYRLWLARFRATTIFIMLHIENTYNQVQEASRDL